MPRGITGTVVQNTFTQAQLANAEFDRARSFLQDLLRDVTKRLDDTALKRPGSVAALIDKTKKLSAKTYNELAATSRENLVRIGQAMGEGWENMLTSALKGIPTDVRRGLASRAFMEAALDKEPMNGYLLKDWWSKLGDDAAFRISRQIQIGVVENESIQQIRERLLGAKGLGRGVMQRLEADAATVIRTGVNEISNQAAYAVYSANKDIAPKFRYVATLDERTSEICAALDGMEWEYDDPDAKYPPQHPNCRSIIVPVIDWKALGIDPEDVPDTTRWTRNNPATGKPGMVSSNTTYTDWLKGQSEAAQNRILGPTRADLFRKGKVSLSQLVKSDGRRLSIEDLERSLKPKAKAKVIRTPLGIDKTRPIPTKTQVREALGLPKAGAVAEPPPPPPPTQPFEFGQKGDADKAWVSKNRGKTDVNANARVADRLAFDDTEHVKIANYLDDHGYMPGRVHDPYDPIGRYKNKQAFLKDVQERWADTSADHDSTMLAFQRAIQEELGLSKTTRKFIDGTSWAHQEADEIYKAIGSSLRKIARATYEETQAYLADNGIEGMSLWRGFAWERPSLVPDWAKTNGTRKLRLQPTSSFSATWDTASGFAEMYGGQGSAVVAMRVPAERIFSVYRASGFGVPLEEEVLVLGGDIQGTVANGRTLRRLKVGTWGPKAPFSEVRTVFEDAGLK